MTSTSASANALQQLVLHFPVYIRQRIWSLLAGLLLYALGYYRGRRVPRLSLERSGSSAHHVLPSASRASLPNRKKPEIQIDIPTVKSCSASRRFGLPSDMFQLEAQLGTGSQGNVYVCTRLSVGNKYAAKVIDISDMLLHSDERLKFLRREIGIMRELHHPRIVNLLDAFWLQEEGKCIVVMDLAEGGDLWDKLDAEVKAAGNNVFPGLGGKEYAARHVAWQMLEAIGYMHWNGVVHRDLKLENILIDKSHPAPPPINCDLLDIKIADFGLSIQKHFKESGGNSPVGSPQYVAPEVLDGDYDERVDFWSFGVILYLMLCGQMPFSAVIEQSAHRESVRNIKRCPSWKLISDSGKNMIRGLLTIDRDERLNREGCQRHPWLMTTGAVADMSGRKSIAEAASLEGVMRKLSKSSTAGTSGDDAAPAVVGAVVRVGGWTEEGVNRLELETREDSPVSSFGFEGHLTQEWRLDWHEYIMAVTQGRRSRAILGDTVTFFTSHRRCFVLEGKLAPTRYRFVAPTGSQIVGLQFEGSRLTGTHVERKREGQAGVVHKICGRTGSAVDQITFYLRDGSILSYGEDRGDKVHAPSVLEPDEFIVIVEQTFRDRVLGAALSFFTSSGRIIRFCGVAAVPAARFMAPPGRQVCGLEFKERTVVGVVSQYISRVRTCPLDGDISQAQWSDLEKATTAKGFEDPANGVACSESASEICQRQ